MREGKPILCIVGYGRAGKDTACEWLRDHTVLRYAGGSSWSACDYMAGFLGKTPEEAYRDRHQDRMMWFNELNKLRDREGPTCLVRRCLTHSDLVCGLRNRVEILGGRRDGLLDLVVWIDRPVPVDPTVEFDVNDADLVIRNHGTLEEFYGRLERFARALKILRGDLSPEAPQS